MKLGILWFARDLRTFLSSYDDVLHHGVSENQIRLHPRQPWNARNTEQDQLQEPMAIEKVVLARPNLAETLWKPHIVAVEKLKDLQ